MNAIKIRFKPGAFPKMLADLSHSNQFLKVFAAGSLCVSLALSALVFVGFTRKPIVIALTPSANLLHIVEMPKPDEEIRQAVLAYIDKRYNWTSASVDKNLDAAKAFVSAQFVQNFVHGVSNVRKFSKEKGVSQRAYATAVSVDLKRGSVTIAGDRITEIQGMRAAGAFNLELSFQGGARSVENPWGVYIVKETEK
jgi:hypothetical protein